MKSLLIATSIFLMTAISAFGQLDTTKMLTYLYDANAAEWKLSRSFEQDFAEDNLLRQEIKSYAFYNNTSYLRHHRLLINNELGKPTYQIDSHLVIATPSVTEWEVFEKEYIYSEDNLFMIIFNERKEGMENLTHKKTQLFHYGAENLISHISEYRLSLENDVFYLAKTTYYQYDVNQCLEDEWIYFGNSVCRTTFTRDENCEILSELYFKDSNNFRKKIDYHINYDNENRVEIDSVFSRNFNGSPRFEYELYRIYDKQDNLIEEKNRLWTGLWYDFVGNSALPSLGNTDEMPEFYLFLNSINYNEENWKLQEDQILIDLFNRDTFHRKLNYNHYCNGNIKEEFVENFNLFYPNQKSYFEYRTKDDCESIDGKVDLAIFPNPSDGLFTIQSNALQGNSSKIRIYTVLGQLVFEKAIPNQVYEVSLNLAQLPKGNYIASVIGNHVYATEKIVIR